MSALQQVRSIKTKLGLLVLVSVLVTALVASVGSAGGVPWWLGLPVTVGLALVVTQLLAAGMVAPLREMTAAATAMSQGRYGVRVLTDNTDEVGELARAFNRMAADLAQVDAERRDLIATVSHELRTPVTAMSAQLENLADGVVEATPERLAQVLDSAERLGALVTDLLTLSRLEAGVVELERSAVPLRALVQECAAEVRRAGRDVDMDVRVADDLVVQADAPRLRQLLVNVLDNAARHAPDGTPVVISAGSEAAGWWLEVLDEGPGVEPDERERVFERFGTDSSGGGTGLGLAIARWVASLHGGRLAFLDPDDGAGARLRLDVAPPGEHPRDEVAPVAAQPTTPATVLPWRATEFWPEDRPEGDVRLVLAALAVGVLGGAVLTFERLGLVWAGVLLLAGGVAWAASARRTSPFTLTTSVVAVGLVSVVAWTENAGLTLLAIVVAAGVFLAGVTDARTFRGMVVSGFVWPAAGVRGLGWLGRSLGVARPIARSSAVLRTVLLSAAGLLVFGVLFSSADATFARWAGALVPTMKLDETVARAFVAVGIFGLTLAAVYVARNPARVDPFSPPVRPASSRWEWLVPLLVVDAVFAVFVASQVRVVLGGHDYVRRTSGLSYAEYVHQGFGQLVVATLLTLVVVWAASRRARTTGADRRWFLAGAGLLCFLAMGVVAAALGRMAVYQDAYGFTTLRVFVNVFEAWLGFVVLALAVLGAWGRGRYVARVALLSGSVALLGLVLAVPDAWVAHRNIDRYEETGKLDVHYLASLSEDAAPVVLERLPREVAGCVLEITSWTGARDFAGVGDDRPVRAWTWSHTRAREAVRAFHAASGEDTLPCAEPMD